MIDFVAIRRRAENLQESSGLGTPEYAASQDILALLGEIKHLNDVDRAMRASYENALLEEGACRERADKDRDEARGHLKLIHDAVVQYCIKHPETISSGYSFARCGACGDVHGIRSKCDPEVLAQNGAFVGPVPHE